MNTLRKDSVVRHGVENIGIIARMSEDIQSKEGDCQIACFDSSLPKIVCMDCRRNHNALLKAMVRFWDPTYRCFRFNEVDMVLTIEEDSTLLHYNFRDLLRIYWKQNTDIRGPLANVMGLLVDTVKARLKDENGPYIS
ncbi:hypothetical protein Gotur_031311 [Gossypium turneri]